MADIPTRQAFGEALCEIGESNSRLIVLDADLASATRTGLFRDKFPERHINAGIAEMNMVGMAAGLAASGKIAVASTFAVFGAGRAYEAIRNMVCYPKLNVKIACTHAGLGVGEDGATHQMLEDIALMNALPNMRVLVPADAAEARQMAYEAINSEGPFYIRLARQPSETIYDDTYRLEPSGGIDVIKDGDDAAIVACGTMVAKSLEAAGILARDGISCAVLNFSQIKPFDSFNLIAYAKKAKAIVTAEEHSLKGGLHSIVAAELAELHPTYVLGVGVDDKFGSSGPPDELFESYAITSADIAEKVRLALRKLI
jgi:transketolase